MRAELLSIGTELLLGQIVDTNSAYLATRLASLGIDCLHMQTVGDNLQRATTAIARALDRSDLIVCTGGLGPTEDDLTREAIAAALGETPAEDPRLLLELEERFRGRSAAMPVGNRTQAWLIPAARALANPLGTAPGWDVRSGSHRLIAMPGVPREMTRMWEVEVEPTLFAGAVLRWRTLKILGMGESSVEEALGTLVRSTAPTVATYAKNDGVHVRITDKDADASAAAERIARVEAEVRSRIGPHIWGIDDDTLARVIARGLAAHGWHLASAESFTGGDVARALMDEPARYRGGVVLPAAGEAALAAAVAHLGAEVTVITPQTDTPARLIVRTPTGLRESSITYREPGDGRRRAALGALDLLRQALSP